MNEWIENVAEFHKTFGVPIATNIERLTCDRIHLRKRLIEEETGETTKALFCEYHDVYRGCTSPNDNLEEIMDGICDSIYVLIGAALEFVGPKCLEECFAEVQRSNMSKLWTVAEWGNAIATGRKEKECLSARDTLKEHDSDGDTRRLVVMRPDMKVIKSPSYSPADLKSIIELHRAKAK